LPSKGWPKGQPKPLTRLRPLFPSGVLAADLEKLALSSSAAAQLAGVCHHVVLKLVRGNEAPRPGTLFKIIEALHLNREPYQAHLAAAEAVTGPAVLVCPRCGTIRTLARGQLKKASRRAQGRQALVQRPDGRYELPCRSCSAGAIGRRALQAVNADNVKRRLGTKSKYILDAAAQGDQKAEGIRKEAVRAALGGADVLAGAHAEFAKWTKGPRSAEHRAAISTTRVSRARVTRPFHLCPLCELVVHANDWHGCCWYTWLGWYRRNVGKVPAPTKRPDPIHARGPKPASHLDRNFRWLFLKRSARRQNREILRLTGTKNNTKSSVTDAIKSFIARLPGSWDLVFSSSKKARLSANVRRQEAVPLPLELQPLVDGGHRDGLINRLLDFSMTPEQISNLTGASLARVQGIVFHRKQSETELPDRVRPAEWFK
jgi:hypothetical protein